MVASLITRVRDKLLSEYGMLLVLLLLVAGFSALTVTDSEAAGAEAGRELAARREERPRQSLTE